VSCTVAPERVRVRLIPQRMNVLPLLREIVHTPVLDIILHLKRSTGLSVNEIAKAVGMSYMGVKQHCIELEKKRMVDTWRRPKATGRPEKVYRLTHKLDGLFPEMGNEWSLALLNTSAQLYGDSAPSRILFTHFQQRTERWNQGMRKSDLASRLKELAQLRFAEGFLSTLTAVEGGWQMTDHHDPYLAVAKHFPLVHDLDRESVEQLLGVPVQQSVEEAGGLRRVIHHVADANSIPKIEVSPPPGVDPVREDLSSLG